MSSVHIKGCTDEGESEPKNNAITKAFAQRWRGGSDSGHLDQYLASRKEGISKAMVLVWLSRKSTGKDILRGSGQKRKRFPSPGGNGLVIYPEIKRNIEYWEVWRSSRDIGGGPSEIGPSNGVTTSLAKTSTSEWLN